MESKTKKEIVKKYKGQVTNLIEKLHCILIYFCIKEHLENVEEIKICKDANFRRIKNLLPLVLKKTKEITITQRGGKEDKSAGHKIALKTFRKKKYASLILNKEMIENVLFEFKI